jgi:hypothetical protein
VSLVATRRAVSRIGTRYDRGRTLPSRQSV